MRRFWKHVLVVVAVSIPCLARASDGMSVGLMLGSPTGLVFKDYLPSGNAWDLGVGVVAPGLRLHVDYLFTAGRGSSADVSPSFYVGLGGMAGLFRGPCGVWSRYCDRAGDAYAG